MTYEETEASGIAGVCSTSQLINPTSPSINPINRFTYFHEAVINPFHLLRDTVHSPDLET
jgi:hypothetical protein